MAEGGEGGRPESFWRVFIRSWLRRGREADLTNVPLDKVAEAAKRGIRVDLTSTKPGEVKAIVNKVAVQGDDEPEQSE